MTITGGSALPKDDIDRMMREAEQYAEEDHNRREAAEARNQAESLSYQTEKFLTESGDKVPADVKGEVETAVADVKKALEGEDTAAITSATERLATVSQKLGQAMYAESQAAQAAQGAGGTGDSASEQSGDEDVVDAEIVDEPDADGAGEGAA